MKNLFTIIALAILFFIASHSSASADSYIISHTCNDGNIVTATVNITPSGPFLMFYQSTFTASGYITSFCGPRNMKLTAQNNNGTVVTLIPETYINPGRYPEVGTKQAAFQSPAGTAGNFVVHFILGVDEPTVPIQHYFETDNLGAITGICFLSPDPYSGEPGNITFTRDLETEQNATARGVTRVSVDYPIRTDNQNFFVTTHIHADFYPGDLSVSVSGYESGIDHSSGGVCAARVDNVDNNDSQIVIQEYF